MAMMEKFDYGTDAATAPYIRKGAAERIMKAEDHERAAREEDHCAIIRRSISEPGWRAERGETPTRADKLGRETFNFGYGTVFKAVEMKNRIPRGVPRPERGYTNYWDKCMKFGKWLDTKLPKDLNLKRS